MEPEKRCRRSCAGDATTKETALCEKKKKSRMLEQILDRRNIERALEQVIGNKGAAGVDGMQTEELRAYLNNNWQDLRARILEGNYKPSPVRKIEIPKPNGGKRMLGIPTVLDRLLQQAISQWMTPKYEEHFSVNSYGFRPNKNAHQAVMQAQEYVREGKEWIVELDLEKFFDKVNHDRLMSILSKTVTDKGTLKLIRSYLTSGILADGVISQRTEGTPQGSPLSPLLSNVILDELDKELEKRGHAYVRYADDCSIYVKSEAAARRVAESIIEYIEGKLLLKVNREKTKVSQPNESTLLGFTFLKTKTGWEIWIADKSIGRIREKCRTITSRSNGMSEEERIGKLQTIIKGWVNYFSISKAKNVMRDLDMFVRGRLRMCQWKAWKRPKTRAKELIRLGCTREWAYKCGYSSKGSCRMAHSQALLFSLTNKVFVKRGYIGFYNAYERKIGAQPSLF